MCGEVRLVSFANSLYNVKDSNARVRRSAYGNAMACGMLERKRKPMPNRMAQTRTLYLLNIIPLEVPQESLCAP